MAGDPILVEPGKLRSTASQIESTAAKFPQQHPPVDNGTDAASKANRGYLTSSAADNFATQLKPVLESIEQRIEQQAESIKDSAKAWEDADEQAAKDLDKIAGEIEA
ncbi:type VII secretion target [Glycomyces rhizosphaerae]|uniref:Type VII secretion target n=1 Tax=Glycomyces rhizosphaerae TaxID=2054422 RepID=A0ABV7Q1H7_9ACTN